MCGRSEDKWTKQVNVLDFAIWDDLEVIFCDLQGRKINYFTNSKTLVSRPTVTRVTFDLPECKEPLFVEKQKKMERNASKKKQEKRK